jgi:hypothetical protein
MSLIHRLFQPADPANHKRGADIDGNGLLDKAEIAQASLHYLGMADATGQPDQASRDLGLMLATLLQGGKDGKGLYADFDGDTFISQDEFSRLARMSGDPERIESSDFQAGFPQNFNANGSSVSINRLTEQASENLTKFQLQDLTIAIKDEKLLTPEEKQQLSAWQKAINWLLAGP